MFSWFKKNRFISNEVASPTYKHVLITIHGFGKKRSKEMVHIKEWGEAEQWNVVCFDMFDHEGDDIPDFEAWVIAAKDTVTKWIDDGYVVDLMGFSMGGVIASYLASQLPIRRLVLLAPAFEFIGLESTRNLLSFMVESLWNDKNQVFINDIKDRLLPAQYWPQFIELVKKYGEFVGSIQCPVLFLHGSADEAVPIRSSRNAYHKVPHNNKKLFTIEDGQHQLSLDSSVNWEVFVLIRLFLDEDIVKVEKNAYNKEVIQTNKIDDKD